MHIVRIVALVFNEKQIACVVDRKLGSPSLQARDHRDHRIRDYVAGLIHLVLVRLTEVSDVLT